jgi:hypothetical protein
MIELHERKVPSVNPGFHLDTNRDGSFGFSEGHVELDWFQALGIKAVR